MTIDAPQKEHLPALRRLWKEAFGDTEEFLHNFERTAFHVDRCRNVTVDGETIAALYWFDCSYRDRRIAYLYAIATAKARRGQGLCRQLMKNTHQHLKTLGYEGAILVPGSKELFEFYNKIGYQTCSYIAEFCCSASTREVALRTIDKTEYTRLRRQFLPIDGVVQEGENLEFLQTMANFYVGDGFLLAARGEGDTLYGTELLGDRSVAPAIVKGLGYAKGNFRTPGTERPFAMYHPLCDSPLAPPSYFGLAFD